MFNKSEPRIKLIEIVITYNLRKKMEQKWEARLLYKLVPIFYNFPLIELPGIRTRDLWMCRLAQDPHAQSP